MSMLASPCPKHPLERVVGVCGSCLKDKLTSLTSSYVGSLDSPEFSPAADEGGRFASASSSLQVEKDEAEEAQTYTNQEIEGRISINQEAINAEEPAKEQEINADLGISNEGISINDEINVGDKSTKWRSKSLCERRGLFNETCDHGPSAIKAEGQVFAAKKVTLRALFAIDDQEQLKSNHKEDAIIISNNVANGEGVGAYKDESRRSVSKKLIEQQSNTPTNSYGCVSSSSSSVCPAVPERIKHSLWFNSLLCRKRGDRRVIKGGNSPQAGIKTTSQLAAAEVTSVFPSAIRANAGGIRANARGHERRWRSNAASIRPTSQWATKGLSVVDSRSERKFNLTARALAYDLPSIFPSEEPPSVIPQTCNDDHIVATERELRPVAQGTPNVRPTAQEQAARITTDHLPASITTTEFLPTDHLVTGMTTTVSYCRSLSCNSTSIPAHQGHHHQQTLPEYRIWEPYYSPGRSPGRINKAKLTATSGRAMPPNGRSGADAARYFSRTVKISPATLDHQTGLLRFYLTPLRSSGRTRFSSARRPPKRGFWSRFLPK